MPFTVVGDKTRRPLEGGTLLPDYLGQGNLLSRTRQLEQRAENMAANMLSSSTARNTYTGRRGALFLSGWGQSSVAASQSAVQLSRYGVAWQAPLILPFGGSVIGLLAGLSSARTAGSLTVLLYIDGSASGLEIVLDGDNPLTVEETAAPGEYIFEAGEKVTVRVTTSADWTPTTADVLVMLEVAAA